LIIVITGDIGSGKSLSVVKEIVDRKQNTFTNFKLYNKKYTRLKWDNIVLQEDKKFKVNFPYWRKQVKKGGFDIYLDEFHNTMNARRSMSKNNVVLSNWLSQIRKILGDQEKHNLYLITQKLRRIDVNSKDLAQCAIKCEKYMYPNTMPTEIIDKDGKLVTKDLPICVIRRYFFNSCQELQNYEDYGFGQPYKVTQFVGNWYYRYYNSYELIMDEEEYV